MTQNIPLIGYDAKRVVSNGTGLGNYGRTLVNDLAKFPLQLRLYAPDDGKEALRAQVSGAANVDFSFRTLRHHGRVSLPSRLGGALWRSRGIVADLTADGVQLFHGLSGELPIGIGKSGIKSIVTIHDLIFLRHPEFYHWLDTKIYAWKFRQTLREADHIIAVSECTRRDIVELGGVAPERISVVYQSFSPRFALPSGDSSLGSRPLTASRYILSVGSIEARKNILLAVRALPYLPDDLSLVVVGRHTDYADTVADYARRHHLDHRVQLLHGVGDEQLPALYAGAEAFVYPSFYEGFGIPIVEAVSCGLPVVACTGSCLEEAGGPDSLYVPPTDVQAMAAAIRQVLRGAEGREGRIARSREYIRRFQGRDVAAQVVELYRRFLP